MSETLTLDWRYCYLGAEDFSYRYSDPSGSITLDAAIASHNLTVGLHFAF